MNPNTVLGLDIGGANLKAATTAGRAVSVPFPLWKQPDALPAALAELVGQFSGIDELAVTMTGELCDCFTTKREGVNRILDAVEFAARSLGAKLVGTALGGTGVPPVGQHENEVTSYSQDDRRDAGPTQELGPNTHDLTIRGTALGGTGVPPVCPPKTEAASHFQDDRRDAGPTQELGPNTHDLTIRSLADRRDAGPTQSIRVAPILNETLTRRTLPHIQIPGHTYHVIFRTAKLQLPPAARQIAFDACLYWNGKKASIHACVVMPDHVHLLLTPADVGEGSSVNLSEILHSIKSYSAHRIKKVIGRTGRCWLDESYDRFIRSDEDFEEKLEYIRNNPAKEGITEYWHEYPFLYIQNETLLLGFCTGGTGVSPVESTNSNVEQALAGTGVSPVGSDRWKQESFQGETGVPAVGPSETVATSHFQDDRRDAGPTQAQRDAGPTLRIRIWSTAGEWLSIAEAREQTLAVAASNWHALATFAARFAPSGSGLLIDIGSTTTDIIPLNNGMPMAEGRTDFDRLRTRELVYVGVKRTPIMALGLAGVCAEYFADTRDMHIYLGQVNEEPEALDTADGRPATFECSSARLARMIGADSETVSPSQLDNLAIKAFDRQRALIRDGLIRIKPPDLQTLILSGAGEWLARQAFESAYPDLTPRIVSLSAELGSEVSACAPAYAVAVLATEMLV